MKIDVHKPHFFVKSLVCAYFMHVFGKESFKH